MLSSIQRKQFGFPAYLSFVFAWLRSPLKVGAVAPSSKALARLMCSEIDPAGGYVLEIGGGTGAFTKAILNRGLPANKLITVERDKKLAKLLAKKFPEIQVLNIDAGHLHRLKFEGKGQIQAVISGLPLLSIPNEMVEKILESSIDELSPGRGFYQFTYGVKCPVNRRIIEKLGLKTSRVGRIWQNLPPAEVYKISR